MMEIPTVDQFFNEVRDCVFKGEHYSVRNNGAILRHAKPGRKSKFDNIWTFGKKDEDSGYMIIGSARVHNIVCTAYHGDCPGTLKEYITDHIDTNRCNNRPENLRWCTRLENVLGNPITRAKIEMICSIEEFTKNPAILRNHVGKDKNFAWMCTVSPEQAENSYNRWMQWAEKDKESRKPSGNHIGEFIFSPITYRNKQYFNENTDIYTESLTPTAKQHYWITPTEFPCCPLEFGANPLDDYFHQLAEGVFFSKNIYGESLVVAFAYSQDYQSIYVVTEADGDPVKKYAMSHIYVKDSSFIHESDGTFFFLDGAMKRFTIAQGLEWTGGNTFDDYC